MSFKITATTDVKHNEKMKKLYESYVLGGRICFIHYQLSFGFDESKGLKCILATQKPIKSVQGSSERGLD